MFRPAVAAIALLALAACAQSGPRRGPGGPPGGGPPSGGAAQGPRGRVFISPAGEPFRAPPGGAEPMRAWFDGADADHDGALNRAEFVAEHMRFFARLDANGDGAIAGPEITRYEEQIAPEILSALDRGIEAAGPGGRRGGPEGGRPPGGGGRRGGGRLNAVDDGPIKLGARREPEPPAGPPQGGARVAVAALFNEPEPVRAADANLDFRVTAAEWTAMAGARFLRLDADHDGRILYAELTPLGGERVDPPARGR